MEMLTNDELLDEEREKADNIKKKMGNVSYGSMGSGKYDNYSNKNYGKTDKHAQNLNS